MRRLFAWIAGLAGGLAAYRFVARRRGGAALEPPAPVPEIDPRAEALRAKLDESREPRETDLEPPAEATSRADTGSPEAGVAEGDPDERRQAVHEHGRAAVEEMQGAGEPAPEEPQ
jgi:hypothetical protein